MNKNLIELARSTGDTRIKIFRQEDMLAELKALRKEYPMNIILSYFSNWRYMERLRQYSDYDNNLSDYYSFYYCNHFDPRPNCDESIYWMVFRAYDEIGKIREAILDNYQGVANMIRTQEVFMEMHYAWNKESTVELYFLHDGCYGTLDKDYLEKLNKLA
jgi:hypothetical protein